MQTWKINGVARAKTEQERKRKGECSSIKYLLKVLQPPSFQTTMPAFYREKLLQTLGSDESDGDKGFLNQYSEK